VFLDFFFKKTCENICWFKENAYFCNRNQICNDYNFEKIEQKNKIVKLNVKYKKIRLCTTQEKLQMIITG
jgi:hypothetical protein